MVPRIWQKTAYLVDVTAGPYAIRRISSPCDFRHSECTEGGTFVLWLNH